MRTVSLAGLILMVAAIVGLLLTHALVSHSPVVIGLTIQSW